MRFSENLSLINFISDKLKAVALAINKLLTRRAMAEFGWICSGQIMYMVLGVFSIKLLSTMGAAKYGVYALVTTLSAILSAVIYGPAEQGFTRYYFEYAQKGEARTLLKLLYQFLVFTALCLAVISILLYPFASDAPRINSPIEFYVIVLFIITSACASPLNSILNALRRRKENAMLQTVERGLAVLCMLILVILLHLTIVSVFIIHALTAFAIILIRKKIIDRHVPCNAGGDSTRNENRREITKKIMTFCLPFMIWGGASWLQSSSERWVIAHYLTISDVGRFAVMIALSNYLIAVPHGMITQYITPILYDKFSKSSSIEAFEEGYLCFNCYILSSIILSSVCILLTFLVGKQMLILISSIEFAESYYLLPVICVGLGLFYQGQTLSQLGIALKIPNRYILPKMGAGFLALALNVICIKYAGLNGAAASVACTGGVYFLSIFYVNAKIKSAARNEKLNGLSGNSNDHFIMFKRKRN